jgi:hypothetical protein
MKSPASGRGFFNRLQIDFQEFPFAYFNNFAAVWARRPVFVGDGLQLELRCGPA